MRTRPILRVVEWEHLKLPTSLDTKFVREQIYERSQSARGPAFRLTPRELRARGLVGLVSTHYADIQIFPKVYADKVDWEAGSDLLKSMLGAGLSFPLSLQIANTKTTPDPLTEIVIGAVAGTLLRQLQEGVPRRYQEYIGDLTVIRGRVDLRRQARRLPSAAHQVAVRYAPLQYDNPLSQLIKATAKVLHRRSRYAAHRKSLQTCLDLLAEVAAVQLSLQLVETVRPSRLEGEWDWIVGIAHALAQTHTPDLINPGPRGGLAILFPLDGLFESLVREITAKALADYPLALRDTKRIGRLFQRDEDGTELVSLEPDLVLISRKDNQVVAIGDAKWKRQSGSHLVPERSDAFQLLTYIIRSAAKYGFLFYPSYGALNEIVRYEDLHLIGHIATVRLIAIDIGKMTSRCVNERNNAEAAVANAITSLIMSAQGSEDT